jgi:hypothetical protein
MNRFDLEDADTINKIRAFYITTQTVITLVYLYTLRLVKSKNDTTVLKYVEPAAPFSGEEPKRITTTNAEYDATKVNELIKQVLIAVGIVGFIHYKWGYVQPLVLQAIMPLKSMFEAKVVKVYVMGQAAVEGLKRPWVADSPFAGLYDDKGYAVDAKKEEKKEKKEKKKAEKKSE